MRETLIVICCISISLRVYCFDSEIIQHKVDLFPLNSFLSERLKTIKNNEIQLENGGTFYNFSDAYPNQFSKPKRKKIKYKQFRELLLLIEQKDIVSQKVMLDKAIKVEEQT